MHTAPTLTLRTALADVDVRTLADTIFAYYDAESCELVSLIGANPAVLAKIRQEAFAARIVAVLHAIERHAAALAGQVDPQIDIDFIMRYRRHVTDYHGKLQPPAARR